MTNTFSDEALPNPVYVSKCIIEEKSIQNIEVSEASILLRGNYDLDPIIFYRTSHKLKEGQELPQIDLSNYYELSPNKGVVIEISPNF